ncbi:MAG: tetratricopeptide repeat protein, partial [Thermodesulfobacteriota bacterium]
EKGRYTPYSAFFGAWVFRNLPLFASTGILGAERLERIKYIDSLPRNASVSSYNGFLRYLENEKELPASNRFSFLYLLMPHIPYVFNDDCTFSADMRDTGALSQSRCATSLIVKFIEKLKELDRFKDSMIIVTADHGDGLRAEGGELKKIEGKLEWHRARSRALLLIKPAGSAGTDKLVTSEFQSSLLDIAPTIAASLAKTPGVNFEGTSLLNPALPLSARKKYYYFFEKKGVLGWTDEMSRFIIEDNRIRADGVVKIENNGESSVARNNIGDFLLAQGRADEAIAEFRKALSLDPGFVKARGNLAKALTSLGRYDEAIAQYETLLAKEPSNSITLQNIGINYTLQGRFKEAIENFERSTELNPSDSYAFYNYALALEGLKKVDEAESAYSKAIELNSREINSRINLANILMRRNDLVGAQALYMEVVGLNPAHALALNNLGIIMNIKKRHVESLKFYERAIEAEPGYESAYYNMGITLEDLGRKSEALERYKEAVRIAPNYADARESLAMIYMKEGLYTLALNEFKALLRIDPQNKKAAKGLKEAERLL